MLETLTRHWWVLAVRGALAVLFGLLALIWPGITVLALVLLFGAYALVDGVMALYTALFDRGRPGGRGGGWLVLEGVAGVLAAIGAVVWPGITALVLLYLIAAWALVTGVAEIVAAIRLRREIEREWLMILSGALSILFGLLAFIFPGAGALAVVWLIAAYAIAFGVVMLILGFRLQRHRIDTVAGGATSATT
ncbi:MAG: HdeD family acid-resistance protein [Kineosporiaceae bacterium]